MTTSTKRPGGRTARTRRAVLKAAREILVQDGAGALTWEALAARSGVNRSTIYRRWSTLGGVVADLASQFADELDYPTTASLDDDLRQVIAQIARMLTPETSHLVQALVGWRDPDIQSALAGFWSDRRSAIGRILAHHGSLADPDVVVRLLGGPLYYSALLENRCPTQTDIDATAIGLLAWVATQNGDPT